MPLTYELLNTDNRARRGRITTSRGVIETPVFMPVGTAATVKAMMPRDLAEVGTQISLANTYHLHIQPGEELVRKAGGLHKFMAMPWPLLTDSGGFQVFSLPKKELTEEGVRFEWRKGEEPIFASPEWSMRVQHALGADIVMAFDECAPWPCSEEHATHAMLRTTRWLDRCIDALPASDTQNLFGIVQGSTWSHLRRQSALDLADRDLPGYAVGGVSVGEGHSLMMKAVDDAEPYMPVNKPRYLMGVGLPEDIVGSVGRGMDMFDCVIPTRYGRSGTCFTARGRIRISDRSMRSDFYPIDTACDCYACRNYSRAYINHLLRSDELLGTMMCSLHNVRFYHRLMADIRLAIEQGRFAEFAVEFERTYVAGDRARRREAFEPGLFASFAVGWADDRARREGVAERERTEAARAPSTRDDARIVDTEHDDERVSRARGAGDRRGPPGNSQHDGGQRSRDGRPAASGTGLRPPTQKERDAQRRGPPKPRTDPRGAAPAAPTRAPSAPDPRDNRKTGRRVKSRR